MKEEYMFAHKLCAFISRYKNQDTIANRDLFDIHFFLQKGINPKETIIQTRIKKILNKTLTTKEFYKYLIKFINQYKETIQKNILYGLGELINEQQKNTIKKELLEEIINLLTLYSH